MRPRQTPLTPELLDYIETNFGANNDFLNSLSNNCYDEANIPQINITPYQANFIQFIIKLINAKNILEIGTLAGYSAVTMALTGNVKQIITIEKNKKHYDYATQKIKEANLEHIVTTVNANAKDFLSTYNIAEQFDLIFVDADKNNYINYLNLADKMLRTGGIFIFDNAFAFGFLLDSAAERNPKSIKSMLNFHKELISRNNYFKTIVPIGDGMLLAIKQ